MPLAFFFRRYRRLALAGWGGVLVLLAALPGCTSDATISKAPAPSVIRIAVPESGSGQADIGLGSIWQVFSLEGLTARGSDGRAVPRLAESWSVSGDGLTWTVTLRPGLLFHDNTPFGADEARRALEGALSRRRQSPLFPGLFDVRDVSVSGDRAITIQLSRPSAFLLDDLDVPLSKPSASGPPIGTGPFHAEFVSSSEVRLRAHAGYHRGTPSIHEIDFKAYPTLRQAWAGLLRGEVEVVSDVSADAMAFLDSRMVEADSFPRRYAYVLAFNSTRPQFRNPAVRNALNYAVNRDAVIKTALRGRGRAASTPVWPEHWAYDKAAAGYSFDPQRASAALAAAGLSGAPGRGRLRFTCLVPEGHVIFERMALMLQRDLFDVGVDLDFESVALSDFDTRLRAGNFDAVLVDLLSGPSLSRVYSFWRSPGPEFTGLNVFGYRNAQADALLDQLRYATDDAATRSATGQLQRVMTDDPPGIFIAWSERARAISRRIEVPAAPGRDPFQSLWQWRLLGEPSQHSAAHE